jgi:hypothetical protein
MIRTRIFRSWLVLLTLWPLMACGGGADASATGGAPPTADGGGGAGAAPSVGGGAPCEAPEIVGDCQLVTCDADGSLVSAPDDEDLPDDDDPCTDDLCLDGVASNPAAADGTACASGTCQQGICATCLTAIECPGSDTFCAQRSCDAGACGFVFTNAGTATVPQVFGDCQQEQCDGAGAAVLVVDNGDLPQDGNDCTEDLCVQGSPANPPLAEGTTCAAGICSGGQCQGCVMASECSGSDDFCQQRTCINATCGVAHTAANTALPPANQTGGDCTAIVCDGNGATTTLPDGGDLPNDNNPCTIDQCSGGMPSFTPAASGTTCPAGQCNGSGQCLGCVDATVCPGQDTFCGQRTCQMNTCGMSYQAAGTALPTQTAGDCMVDVCDGTGGTTAIVDDGDAPPDPSACVLAQCQAGVSSTVNAPSATVCGSNRVCDGSGHCALDPLWDHAIGGLVRGIDAAGTDLVVGGIVNTDAWLAKYGSNGTLAWQLSAGSFFSQQFYDVAVGPNGDIYTVGDFQSSIDLGGGVFTAPPSGQDGFIARFDATGAHQWSVQIQEPVRAVASRPGGGFVAAGPFTNGINIDGTTLLGSGENVWVAAWDAADNLIWAQAFYSPTSSGISRVHVDATGTTHVVGGFVGSISIGADNYTAGVSGGYVASLDASGQVSWSHGYGSWQSDVVTDAASNVYVVGDYEFGFTLGSVTIPAQNNPNLLMAFSSNGTPSYGASYWNETMSAVDDLRAVERGVSGEILIGGSRDGSLGLVKAVSGATGAVSWEHRVFNQALVNHLARASDGALYVAGSGYVAKLLP